MLSLQNSGHVVRVNYYTRAKLELGKIEIVLYPVSLEK